MATRAESNPLPAAHAVLLENVLAGTVEALRILVNEAAKGNAEESRERDSAARLRHSDRDLSRL